MSFLSAARAALAGQNRFFRMLPAMAVILLLALLSLSCGSGSSHTFAPNHVAYVTLPSRGSVLLLRINGSTGAITVGGETPAQGTSPTGLALSPSRQFLYAVNSFGNTISIFSIANDGTLTLTGTPIQAGNGPNEAVIDPSGQYLLVTNNYGNNPTGGDISVYSINATTGGLTEVAGSPFPANANPSQILFTHSGQFVYVVNPGIGMVSGFSFNLATGVLSQLPSSPVFSGTGAADLAVDASDQFLYVANLTANNPPPYQSTTGNISAFNIVSGTGALTPILGSPFTSTSGNGPSAITVDPSGRFVYAVTSGSSNSVWCFTITPTNGELVPAANSPFSVAAGGLFALFDPSGNFLFIGSQAAHGVQGYTYNPSTGALKSIAGSPFSTTVSPAKMVLSE
jgi:6-phosphogluconolactonase (cycloisomerase 2 family)